MRMWPPSLAGRSRQAPGRGLALRPRRPVPCCTFRSVATGAQAEEGS